MRAFGTTILLLTLIIFFSYKPVQKDKVNLVGSWEIISYIDHENKGTEWLSYGDEIIKQKHITPTHFTWLMYDKEEDRLMGLGGGTYIINNNGEYVENIDFFYPPGSSELGQSIPFDVKFQDGNWYHTGYAKRMEINGLGLLISTDSVKIEEIWSPVTPKSENEDEIVGTWRLEKLRTDRDGDYQYYPDYMGYLKLLTPTHFIWVQYNKDGDEIFASGSGPYKYKKKNYIETLEMTHPSNSNVKGAVIKFDIELTGTKWKHYGWAPEIPGKTDGDENLIDEYWIRYTSDIDDETAFYDSN